MRVRHWCALCAAAVLGGSALAQAPSTYQVLPGRASTGSVVISAPGQVMMPGAVIVQADPKADPKAGAPEPIKAPEAKPGEVIVEEAPAAPADEPPLGPAPPDSVKFLQKALAPIFGDPDKPCIKVYGWMDFDYTFNNNGPGLMNGAAGGPGLAPVMNRFGDEFLCRQLGLALSKPLDPKEFSLGFNAILIAGNDAAFLNPTAGWFANTNPRFGVSFTDLNGTAHLPILTEAAWT